MVFFHSIGVNIPTYNCCPGLNLLRPALFFPGGPDTIPLPPPHRFLQGRCSCLRSGNPAASLFLMHKHPPALLCDQGVIPLPETTPSSSPAQVPHPRPSAFSLHATCITPSHDLPPLHPPLHPLSVPPPHPLPALSTPSRMNAPPIPFLPHLFFSRPHPPLLRPPRYPDPP